MTATEQLGTWQEPHIKLLPGSTSIMGQHLRLRRFLPRPTQYCGDSPRRYGGESSPKASRHQQPEGDESDITLGQLDAPDPRKMEILGAVCRST